jgi:glycosyltransferase involved in cell wall biosynthesis
MIGKINRPILLLCGFGYMSQAVSLLEEECFQKGIQRIEMSIDTLNYPSIKLARGLGYHFEGLLREESRLYSDEKQKPRSTLIFSKLKKDQIVLSPEEKNIIEQAKTYPKLPLTVTIIAYNEESNIARAIQSVLPLTQDIVVIDSGSSDRTVAIARAWGARVSYEPWRGYGQQKNYAQSKVKNDWILNLDADEECTQELRDEIRNLFIQKVASAHQAYAFPRLSYFLNQQIHHGGWYPNFSTRLYLKDSLVWSEPTVHETLISKTSEPVSIGKLKSQLYHYPFQSIREQIETNLKFSRLGYESHKKNQSFVKVKMLFKPLWKFVHVYFIQLGFLDGWHGFVIAVNAMHSMFLRFAYHLEIENNVQNNVQNKNQRKLKS